MLDKGPRQGLNHGLLGIISDTKIQQNHTIMDLCQLGSLVVMGLAWLLFDEDEGSVPDKDMKKPLVAQVTDQKLDCFDH